MRTHHRNLHLVRSLILVSLAVLAPRPASAQSSAFVSEARAPADGWQRGLEIGGLVATFFAVGCGNGLLDRQERNDWAWYNQNRNWHLGLSMAAGGINLASAWQQWQINRERTTFEFRHIAHNTLFWTNIAGLVGSAVLGVVATQMHSHGDLDAVHDLGSAMKVTGFVSIGTALTDVIFFGGHDNRTIF